MHWFLLSLFLLILAVRLWLRRLNLRHLAAHGHEIPSGFEGLIDHHLLARTSDYTLAGSRVGLLESLIGNLLLALFIFGGLLAWYDQLIAAMTASFLWQGLLFVIGLTVVQTLLDAPFSLYRTFVLETRFGFNTSTLRIWIIDQIKSLAIGMVLLSLVTAGALTLVQVSPGWWWLWVWGFFAVVTLLLMYLSPVLIEPLFFKFEPLQRPELAAQVKTVMARAGLQIDRVQQVDASRRSKHSNAYFTGIGRVKRIVLFDTLLAQMSDDEILGVLAHEAGHWRLGHIWKRLLGMQAISLFACWLAWLVLGWGGLPALFGIGQLGFPGQVLLLGFLGSLLMFPLTPLFSGLSRRHEWQADHFAVQLTGAPQALARALAKLSKENLSNLHPHPLYVYFYYSHPPMAARIATLLKKAGPNSRTVC